MSIQSIQHLAFDPTVDCNPEDLLQDPPPALRQKMPPPPQAQVDPANMGPPRWSAERIAAEGRIGAVYFLPQTHEGDNRRLSGRQVELALQWMNSCQDLFPKEQGTVDRCASLVNGSSLLWQSTLDFGIP